MKRNQLILGMENDLLTALDYSTYVLIELSNKEGKVVNWLSFRSSEMERFCQWWRKEKV